MGQRRAAVEPLIADAADLALVVLAAGRARRYGGCKPLAPVGPAGEAVIDLVASDAVAAGFGRVVLVVGPASSDAIRYHVRHSWPRSLDVAFARQEEPLGTVHAVLAAGDELARGAPFAVGNADDLYGEGPLRLLARHLAADDPDNALVGYRLANAVVGDSPVTRGVCRVDGKGRLVGLEERRQVSAIGDGRFVSKDGLEPSELDGSLRVSMNLWGFNARMWDALDDAMARAGDASVDAEVLLPDLVAALVTPSHPGGPVPFRVLNTDGRCIGVTHPDDLQLVQADVARQVGLGERPARLWSGVG